MIHLRDEWQNWPLGCDAGKQTSVLLEDHIWAVAVLWRDHTYYGSVEKEDGGSDGCSHAFVSSF